MTGRVRGLLAAALVPLVLMAGCATSNPTHRQAEADDDGVQATGVLDRSRVAISRGVPDVVFGDCDPGDGLDRDICWVARTIDGLRIAFVIENPAVLEEGATLPVLDSDCVNCDDVTDGVVVEVRVDGEARRPVEGSLEVRAVPGERAAADFEAIFRGGDELRGSFNVRELRPEER
jgi:hypothetical protein